MDLTSEPGELRMLSAYGARKTEPCLRGPGDNVEMHRNAVTILQAHTSEAFVCAFNPTRPEILATGSKNAALFLWTLPESSMSEGRERFAQRLCDPLVLKSATTSLEDTTAIEWNSEGSLLATGYYDGVLRVHSISGFLHFSTHQHAGPIFAAKFSKSGNWLITASLDESLLLWDMSGVQPCLHRQYRFHAESCLDVCWLDDSTFVSCGGGEYIYVSHVDADDPFVTISGHQNEVNQVICNLSRTRLASCSDDMTSRVWSTKHFVRPTGTGANGIPVPVVLEGHTHFVNTVIWCPNPSFGLNEVVATASHDRTARLWDSVTGECLRVFRDHNRPLYTISFSPDGRWVVTGGGDGWIYGYDVATKERVWSWHTGPGKKGVFDIDWQQQGQYNRMAVAMECRDVVVFDVKGILALAS